MLMYQAVPELCMYEAYNRQALQLNLWFKNWLMIGSQALSTITSSVKDPDASLPGRNGSPSGLSITASQH